MTTSRATSLAQFQALVGVVVGLAAGSFCTPLTATTTRWFTRQRFHINPRLPIVAFAYRHSPSLPS